MKKYAIMMLSVFLIAGCQQKKEEKKADMQSIPKPAVEKKIEFPKSANGNPLVLIETTKGNMEVEVFVSDAPIHGQNFLDKVEDQYYDGLIFHRVIPDFMIQTGDPTGTGSGGPAEMLSMEAKPFNYQNKRSFIAMAQSPKGVNASQFYILVKDSPHLDDKFPCFAQVINGMDVADAISKVKTDANDRPVEPVVMLSIKPMPMEQAVETSEE